jgi:hypothetical protein
MDGRFVLTVDLKGKMAIWEVRKSEEEKVEYFKKFEKEKIGDLEKKILPLSLLISNKMPITFKIEQAVGGFFFLFVFCNIKNYCKKYDFEIFF